MILASDNEMNLVAGEVHVWSAWLDQEESIVQQFGSVLSSDELERAARFKNSRARREFILARGCLRQFLAAYTGCGARDFLFVYNAQGKPSLDRCLGLPHTFNLSHSGGLALFAFAVDRDLGIDVERVSAIGDADEIAQRFFSKEEAQRLTLETEHKYDVFFRLWTRKEAVLKCSGEGITDATLDGTATADCTVFEFKPFPDFQAALAVAGNPVEVKHFHLSDGLQSSGLSALCSKSAAA